MLMNTIHHQTDIRIGTTCIFSALLTIDIDVCQRYSLKYASRRYCIPTPDCSVVVAVGLVGSVIPVQFILSGEGRLMAVHPLH